MLQEWITFSKQKKAFISRTGDDDSRDWSPGLFPVAVRTRGLVLPYFLLAPLLRVPQFSSSRKRHHAGPAALPAATLRRCPGPSHDRWLHDNSTPTLIIPPCS